MIKKTMTLLMATLMALILFSGSAYAEWYFGIESSYQSGDEQATFEIVLVTDETITLGAAYGLAFTFDAEELEFVNYENTPPGSWNLMPNMPTAPAVTDDGSISGFNAMGFAFPTVTEGSYTLGSFTFNVLDTPMDGNTDFNWALEDKTLGFRVNGIDYSVSAGNLAEGVRDNMTDTGSPNAVPIPAAAWLFGTGLFGMIGMRRKNSAVA